MRIAVLGGGAAGLATAYYLSKQHEVFLFEKQAVLGGNIRTLGRNISCDHLPAGITLDNGVIEFLADKSPHLSSLLSELGIESRKIRGGSTSLFVPDGRFWQMPDAIGLTPGWSERLRAYARLAFIARSAPAVMTRLKRLEPTAPFGAALTDDLLSQWLRGLIMYGFSMPYATIDQFPAGIAREALQRCNVGTKWMRIVGGVYTYIEAILARANIDCRLGVLPKLTRTQAGLVVTSGNGGPINVDRVVVATPPHRVSQLIARSHPGLTGLFARWGANEVDTIVHTDTSLYKPWQPNVYTEFDIFIRDDGRDAGYNAYLNRLADIPEYSPTHYFLAYNLQDRIAPERILHTQHHESTRFSAQTDNRASIRALNGTTDVYFAGAYLYDGLHEGAIESARAVADAVNGAPAG